MRGPDGLRRCAWSASAPENAAYHDDEWGRPVTDDMRLYEKLCLEGFQSGLSWESVCEWGRVLIGPSISPASHPPIRL